MNRHNLSQTDILPSRRPLSLESLESRQLMAGDVSVGFEGGVLVIRGDNLANEVEMVSLTQAFSIRGLNGTTINGVDGGRFVLPNPTSNVKVLLNGGDDVFDAKAFFASFSPGEVTGNLEVIGGTGQDRIVISDMNIGNDLQIRTEGGSDSIELNRVVVGDDLDVSMGFDSSADAVKLSNVDALDQILINTDQGDDILNLNRVKGAHLTIHGGSGNNLINMTEIAIDYNLTINTFDGSDDILLGSTTADKIFFSTGGSNDQVDLIGVKARELDMLLGSGDDVIRLFSVSAADAEINGQSGNDNVIDLLGPLFSRNTFGSLRLDSIA